MKKKWKSIGICALLFITIFLFSWLFFITLSNVFVKFNVISQINSLWISIVGGIIIAIAILIYVLIRRKSIKETKFSNWIALNYHKIILWYSILIIIFGSIKKDVIWTLEELRNTVSLEWSIFAISTTIFLVWKALFVPHLSADKPKASNDMSLLLKIKYIEKKSDFYQNVSLLFNSTSLLLFNLVVLIYTTGLVYISSEKANVFNQNVTIICLYLCTNALVMLFVDIFKQLKSEKQELLEGMKVTQEDIDFKNTTIERMVEALKAIDAIDKLTNMDDEEKEQIKNKLLKDYVETPKQLEEAKEEIVDKQ